jgi:hypothetical protein
MATKVNINITEIYHIQRIIVLMTTIKEDLIHKSRTDSHVFSDQLNYLWLIGFCCGYIHEEYKYTKSIRPPSVIILQLRI